MLRLIAKAGGHIWVVLGLVVGCAGDPVEIEVGDIALTRSEVEGYYRDELSRAAVGSSRLERDEFVPNLLRRLQLLEEGRARGLDRGPEIEARRRSEHKAAVLRSMAPDVIDTEVSFSPEEIESVFALRNTERRARHIIVKTKKEANEIMGELADGMSFETAVRQFSLAGRAKTAEGDLGWSTRGRMVQAVDEVIFSRPVGSEPEVVRSGAGYHVLEVTGERLALCPSLSPIDGETPREFEKRCDLAYEEELRVLEEKMIDEELSNREQAYLSAVVDQVDIVWNETLVDQIAGVAREERSNPVAMIEAFGADTAEVLLEANEEIFSMGWFLSEYGAYDPVRRAKLTSSRTIESFFRSLVIEDFMYRDGIDRGVGDRPAVEEATVRGVERLVARRTKDALMSDLVPPTREEIESYYASNKKEFRVPDRIMIREITTPYRERIDMADSLLAIGVPFKAVAMNVSIGVTARYGGSIGPFKKERRSERWAQADTLEIGQRTPPFEDGENWSIVELKKRIPAHDQSLDDAYASIRNRMVRDKKEELATEMQQELNRLQPVKWNQL